MNKYFNKQTVMSFILGGIVFSSIGIFAATEIYEAQKATFDVLVNGETFISDKPTVVIEGSTYIPLKDTGEALGVDVDWNSENKCVEIKNNNSLNSFNLETLIITPESTPIVSTDVNINTNNESEVDDLKDKTSKTIPTIPTIEQRQNKPKSTPDGITEIDIYDGKYYIGILQIKNKIKENGFVLENTLDGFQISKDNQIILENIEVKFLAGYGNDAIEYDYYVETILPLIE